MVIWKRPGPDGAALSDPETYDITGAWLLASPALLSWREWDEEFVVHNVADDAVHYLSDANAAVFGLLARSHTHVTALGLADSLTAYYEPGTTTEQIYAMLSQVLPEFMRLGLVSRCPYYP